MIHTGGPTGKLETSAGNEVLRSGRRSEPKISDISDAVLAPELIPFGRKFGVGVNDHLVTIPTAQQKHVLDLVELELILMFLPKNVTVLAD